MIQTTIVDGPVRRGQLISGNPRGRNKGPSTIGDILRRRLQRQVRVKRNGELTKMPLIKVLIERACSGTMNGNLKDTVQLFAMIDRYAQALMALAPESQSIKMESSPLLGSGMCLSKFLLPLSVP